MFSIKNKSDMNDNKKTFPPEELQAIDKANDLHIAPFREDGKTHGTPTWIWEVVVGNELYVRAYNGTSSRWYKAAMNQGIGKIEAAGMVKEVRFESVDGAINDRIDEAYREKYSDSPYLRPMISNRARSATVKILPREAE